ncbi:hypothetical protein SADUNF_Sadunf16G0190900 [Salix dunnii]|uniref:Uncharacterized protein n=1 Tax=Salix dunnii TaxID=1413687 RepID=A0A835J9L7_9ROSI|nr:hypothetical protein SADUNF_Sadunf16G0190900 [Salix dunnii]
MSCDSPHVNPIPSLIFSASPSLAFSSASSPLISFASLSFRLFFCGSSAALVLVRSVDILTTLAIKLFHEFHGFFMPICITLHGCLSFLLLLHFKADLKHRPQKRVQLANQAGHIETRLSVSWHSLGQAQLPHEDIERGENYSGHSALSVSSSFVNFLRVNVYNFSSKFGLEEINPNQIRISENILTAMKIISTPHLNKILGCGAKNLPFKEQFLEVEGIEDRFGESIMSSQFLIEAGGRHVCEVFENAENEEDDAEIRNNPTESMLPFGRVGVRADPTVGTRSDGRRMMTGGLEDAHLTASIQSARRSDQLTHGLDPTVILTPDRGSEQLTCGIDRTDQMMPGGASGMMTGGSNSTAHNMADRELGIIKSTHI